MILALLPDIHLRSSNPENRIDNYEESLWEKLRYIWDYPYKTKTTRPPDLVFLQPGDFFDGPIQSNALLSRCFNNLAHRTIYTVWGQHDLKYRTKGNTVLDVLMSGEIVEFRAFGTLTKQVVLYSCSYDEKIPVITTPDDLNILLIHKMIVEEKIWEGQVEYTWANTILRQTKFDLIVSGDNHQSFIVESKNRLLVNCGSLMRIRKDQINHKPMFVIYDTDTRKYQKVYIPIKPAEEVFDMAMLEREKEKDERLAAYVEGLIEGCEIGLDFQANLFAAIKTNKVNESVETIIKEAMQDGN